MKYLILEHKREHKIDNIHPCKGSCPFENLNHGYTECMHCYELFPGWGDFALNHKSKRAESQYTAKGLPWPMCPCHTLGTEFVSWRIALYLEKGI